MSAQEVRVTNRAVSPMSRERVTARIADVWNVLRCSPRCATDASALSRCRGSAREGVVGPWDVMRRVRPQTKGHRPGEAIARSVLVPGCEDKLAGNGCQGPAQNSKVEVGRLCDSKLLLAGLRHGAVVASKLRCQMWSQGSVCFEIVLVPPAWKLAERCLVQEVFDHRELEVLEPLTWEEAAEASDNALLGE